MKRFRLNSLLCLVFLVVLVACRNEADQAPASDPTATATQAAARGEEVADGAATPETVPTPVEETADTSASAGLIYSVPFEVRPDGFGFRNYGANFPEGDFTIEELRAQFGDGVCSRIKEDGDVCIPTAEAQQWIDDRNADMRVGHCIGFTVASYRFNQGDLQPETFGPEAETPFDIERKVPIMRTIAANGALYWVKSVWSSEVSGTPREVLDALIALREPVDLSIYMPGLVGGHSLLAYGVEEVAPQQYRILVYDNNFPGKPTFVEVDYAANTWRYDQGAVNPELAAVPYEGDATTETLRFIPLSAYEGATCPFCSPQINDEEIEAFTLLTFLGQGDVLVETALGAIGWVAGEIVNEIPGARLIFQRGQLSANDTPDIILPAGLDYTAQFTGMERVSSLGPEASLVLDQLTPSTEESTLAVTSSTQSLEYQAGGEQSPALRSTLRQNGTTYSVALLGVDFADGQSLSMGADEEKGALTINSPNAEVTNATLLIARLTAEDEAIFATTSLGIGDGGGVALDVASWDGSGSMDVYVDENGDGEFAEDPTELPNEPLTEVIQQSAANQIANVVNNVSPYLGQDGLDTLLTGLGDQDLSGQEIGEILRPLNLTDEQLTGLILTYALPVPELAELLFALRLEPERLDTIIEALELEEADEAELRDFLANLALYHEILDEWEFLNSDDMARLAALLNERDLSVQHLGQLLPRFRLSEEELQQVLAGLDLSLDELAELASLLGIELPAPGSTPAATRSATSTPTASPTPTATLTVTPTPSTTPTPTVTATPLSTPTPDPYPEAPTATPDSYPYPVPSPSPTENPNPYPGSSPTAAPANQSVAYCDGNDLRVVAQEPAWRDATIEIWSAGTLMLSGATGPDGEPFEATFPGPGTWDDLYIASSIEPTRVSFGSMSCPG